MFDVKFRKFHIFSQSQKIIFYKKKCNSEYQLGGPLKYMAGPLKLVAGPLKYLRGPPDRQFFRNFEKSYKINRNSVEVVPPGVLNVIESTFI